MSFISDVKIAKDRFAIYIDQLSRLLQEYNVKGDSWYENLKKANEDHGFVARRDAIWRQILEQEGGKLTLGLVLGIVGAVLGGVGIAGAWGAFGLPLVLLLAPVGVWIGNELDAEGVTKRCLAELESWFRRTEKKPDVDCHSRAAEEAKTLSAWQEKMRSAH